MGTHRVIVIGAGVGGLTAAALLAARGVEVTIAERAETPGGKIRAIEIEGRPIDSGPTVFTMRPLFEQIFADAGDRLERHLTLTRAEILARHSWGPAERLDLFSDEERSADAIAAFAGPQEGRRYLAFVKRSRDIFKTLEAPFLHKARPSPLSLVRDSGLTGLPALMRIQPYVTLWQALGRYFHDPRLRQLFGRYATYCGSSPFAAPGTLMLIAHVEREGVWLVQGGTRQIALALAALAERNGARLHCGAHVTRIDWQQGRASGVTLDTGERLEADAVLVNADAGALAQGCFGPEAARGVRRRPERTRSLSALTWSMLAEADGFPLLHHSVFFSDDYRGEFDALLRDGRLPQDPTVYVCAQDRGGVEAAGDAAGDRVGGRERLFCLVNAPARDPARPIDAAEIARCEERTFQRLERSGLRINRTPDASVMTTPTDFEALFPATGGALYGPASHGWMASFQRPTARTRLPGLYLAGGSVHPGAGVPMAALSGRLAAEVLTRDLALIRR